MSVAEIVQTDAGESRTMHEFLERVGQELGVVRRAVVAGEDVRIVVARCTACAEHVDGAPVGAYASSRGVGLPALLVQLIADDTSERFTDKLAASRSKSPQRSPSSSPRRMPAFAATHSATSKR